MKDFHFESLNVCCSFFWKAQTKAKKETTLILKKMLFYTFWFDFQFHTILNYVNFNWKNNYGVDLEFWGWLWSLRCVWTFQWLIMFLVYNLLLSNFWVTLSKYELCFYTCSHFENWKWIWNMFNLWEFQWLIMDLLYNFCLNFLKYFNQVPIFVQYAMICRWMWIVSKNING